MDAMCLLMAHYRPQITGGQITFKFRYEMYSCSVHVLGALIVCRYRFHGNFVLRPKLQWRDCVWRSTSCDTHVTYERFSGGDSNSDMTGFCVCLQLVGRRVLTLSSRSLGSPLGRIDAYSPRAAQSRDVQVCVHCPVVLHSLLVYYAHCSCTTGQRPVSIWIQHEDFDKDQYATKPL